MKSNLKRWYGVIAAVILIVGLAFSPLVQKAHAVSTQTPWQNLTPSQLTVVWWQWLYSVPASESPVLDDTGANAYNGQPYSDLLFLCGTWIVQEQTNGDVLGKVTRQISVKQGTALFFPLVNTEWDNICNRPSLGGNCNEIEPFPHVLGVRELRALAAAGMDSVSDLYAKLTQNNVTSDLDYTRLQSPPFRYRLPATDNLYQSQYDFDVRGTVAPAVADGFYSFIPGLTPGDYVLEFGGKIPFDGHNFILEITYEITVPE